MPALIPSLALAALALQAPAAAASPAAGPAATPATPAAAEAPSQAGLDELVRAFHDSCEVRLYGEYDDMCSSLSDQIRRYRAALARASHRAARP